MRNETKEYLTALKALLFNERQAWRYAVWPQAFGPVVSVQQFRREYAEYDALRRGQAAKLRCLQLEVPF